MAPNILGLPALHIFGICDGHGQFGRDVSSYVKTALPALIEKCYNKEVLIEDNVDPYGELKIRLKECFIKVNKDIEQNVPNC